MSFRRPISLTNKQKTDTQYLFTQLSVLEMKKKITAQERKNVVERVVKIDEKIKEIDSTITELLAFLDLCMHSEQAVEGEPNHQHASPPALTSNNTPAPASVGHRRFVMRY
jgi:hypothetical protein